MGSFKRAVIFLSHAFAAIHFSAAAADCGQRCWSAAPQMQVQNDDRWSLMFMTEQLNLISQLIIDKPMSEKPLGLLEQKYVNLEATLLRAKILRNFAKKSGLYIVQSEIEEQQSNLGFLFSPFILANLNKPVIYSTPMAQPVLNILNKYYTADKAPNFKINETPGFFQYLYRSGKQPFSC